MRLSVALSLQCRRTPLASAEPSVSPRDAFSLLAGRGLRGGAKSARATGQGADQPLDAGAAFRRGIVLVFAGAPVADIDRKHGTTSLELAVQKYGGGGGSRTGLKR
jgi:hypothetical protein